MREFLKFVVGHLGYAFGLLVVIGIYVLLAPQEWPGYSFDVFDDPSTQAGHPAVRQDAFAPTVVPPLGVVAQVGVPLLARERFPIGQPISLPPELGLLQPKATFGWETCSRNCHAVPGATTRFFIPRCDPERCDVGKRIRFRDGAFVSEKTPAVTPSETVKGRPCEASACVATDVDLLSRHKPILKLSSGEPWGPVAVDDVIGDYGFLGNRTARLNLAQLAAAAQDGVMASVDNLTCRTSSGVDCYGRRVPKYSDAPAKVLYGRVWRNPSAVSTRDPAFALQYWLFYYFDAFPNNRTFFGTPSAWQLHESDWEFVELLLDRRLRPLIAAYSQHCSGRLRRWSSVEKRGGHPLVWIALGSHANYFAPTSGTPAPAACSGARRIPENLVTGSKGFFDVADGRGGPLLVTNASLEDELLNITAPPRWLFFRGRWGEGNYVRFHLPGGGWRAIRVGDSPDSPGTKKEWRDPLVVLNHWPFDG